ncbi:hypothetical protein BHE74_00008723 [Ensete ventricosum]|nr:hypothetical protein BHE74_00008723 [Ensete ventricosum]
MEIQYLLTKEALARCSRAWPWPAPLEVATGCSQGPPTKGRPAAAKPPWRWRPAVAKAPLQRGDRLRPSPLQRVAAGGHDRLQPARKGRLPTEHLQGGGRQRPARKGQPEAASPAASRDDDPYQGDCQPQRAAVACAGAAATTT